MSRGMMWLALFGMLAFVVLLFRGCVALVSSFPSPAPATHITPAAAVAAAPAAREATVAPAAPAAAAADKPAEKTLGISLDEYIRNFNEIGAKLKPKLRISGGEVQPGLVNDVSTITIDSRRVTTITLKKGTREVKEVMMMGQGDGTAASGLYLMITALTVIQAGLPEAERAGVGEVFGRLLSRMERDADAVHENFRGRKVWMNSSTQLGFWAGISPATPEE